MYPKERGLSSEEVQAKQRQFGLNVLPEKPKPSNISLFVSQLKNPLIYILLLASAITFLIRHFSDTVIILLAVGLNTILGFVQERKASDALFALKQYVANKAVVVRDGKRETLDTSQLVPGDIVVLGQGTKVPADGTLVHANRLYVDESILTGESASVNKSINTEVYMGTTIAAGQATMRVEKIGTQTKIGSIALQIQKDEEDTPLQKQINAFSKQLVIIIAVLISFIMLVGVLHRFSYTEIFVTSVALAVSSIPEGLIVSMTVILAIGMQKILRRKGLVRKLAAAETLGGVTVICVDKTGTLTAGKMEVVEVVGDKRNIAEQLLLANDLDDPLVIAAFEWGRTIVKDFVSDHPRFDSIPFSSETRSFVSLHQWSSNNNRLFVNGAPEVLLGWTTLDEKEKREFRLIINDLAKQGKRLLGLAYKDVSVHKKNIGDDDGKHDLTWVGIVAFSDPVRKGVKEALEKAQSAGVRTIVITGDYAKTSQYVLAQLDIKLEEKQVLTGEEIVDMSEAELAKKVKTVQLFARTTPTQKFNIVKALKKNGEIVAMMGDGVNDAPALHKADIGIVVGEATDVAKESADLVLLDSNFATIVGAIEEGRAIFENIRKVILYLMCDAFEEIFVILGSIMLGYPLALTAVQILWVNLVSDGFPSLALTIDPVRKEIMQEKPRFVGERLISTWMIVLIGVVSVVSGLLTFISFILVYKISGDISLARSISFITLGLNSLTYVFSVRSLMNPFRIQHLFANTWLIVSLVAGVGLQILPFTTTASRHFFGLIAIDLRYWIIAVALSMVMFIVIEACKFVYHVAGEKGLLKK